MLSEEIWYRSGILLRCRPMASKWETQGEMVRQLIAANTPLTVICTQTGVSPQTVYDWIHKHGWEYHPTREKLTSKGIRATGEALVLVDAGLAAGKIDIEAIAKRCGVSSSSVRRIIERHRAAERDALRALDPTEKLCSGCQLLLPLSAFPERADRIGKLHALCLECRLDWSRCYRHDNPIPIREASRRRRARLRGSRTDDHKESDIIERDSGLCWFCKEAIDLSLVYPDPMALAINHIHPVAKGGPDIAKNVAPAHAICNRQAKDKTNGAFHN